MSFLVREKKEVTMSNETEVPARLYGLESKGFTDQPQVTEILSPYCNTQGSLTHFDGLPAGKAADLMKLCPKAMEGDKQNDAPTFGKMVEVGLKFGRVWFHGYIVKAERDDERITIEGFYAPLDIAEAVKKEMVAEEGVRAPDEWGEQDFADVGKVKRAWWD